MEDLVGRPLFLRDSRSVSLTHDGQLLLEHAHRVLSLNSEIISQFLTPELVGEVRLGAPDDVSERLLPPMLRRFARTHPCLTVNVTVESTVHLLEKISLRQIDLALVSCDNANALQAEIEVILRERMVWAGLRGGVAIERNPLPISMWEEGCAWRKSALDGLDAEGHAYRIAFQSAHISGQRAAILADLAIAPMPITSLSGDIVEMQGARDLPSLPDHTLGLIVAKGAGPAVLAAADHLRASFVPLQGRHL